jgi:hypothetical protein
MNENVKENWDRVKDQLRSEYPQLEDDDLDGEPDEVADKIAERTGQNRETVEASMGAIAGQSDTDAEQASDTEVSSTDQ